MKNSTATKKLLSISDFPLVVTLSLFLPIQRVERDADNPNRCNFLFAQSLEADELMTRYYRHELTVEPQQFFNQIRAVKARLPL